MKLVYIIPFIIFGIGLLYFSDLSISKPEDPVSRKSHDPILYELIKKHNPNEVCYSEEDKQNKCIDFTLEHQKGLMFAYETPYVHGKKNGIEHKYIVYSGNQLHLDAETRYYNNVKEGLQTRFNKKGQPFALVNYENDLKEGFERFFFLNGHLRLEVHYSKGKKNGLMRTFNTNGILVRSGYYKDDLEHGYFRVYTETGKLISQNIYKNGKLQDITIRYYPEGNLQNVVPFENGVSHGMAVSYYQNGIVRSRTPMSNGFINGQQRQYHRNGKIKSLINYKNSQVVGEILNYDFYGRLLSKFEAYRLESGIFRDGKGIWFKDNKPYVEVEFKDDKPIKGRCLEPNAHSIDETELFNIAKSDILPNCAHKQKPVQILE